MSVFVSSLEMINWLISMRLHSKSEITCLVYSIAAFGFLKTAKLFLLIKKIISYVPFDQQLLKAIVQNHSHDWSIVTPHRFDALAIHFVMDIRLREI